MEFREVHLNKYRSIEFHAENKQFFWWIVERTLTELFSVDYRPLVSRTVNLKKGLLIILNLFIFMKKQSWCNLERVHLTHRQRRSWHWVSQLIIKWDFNPPGSQIISAWFEWKKSCLSLHFQQFTWPRLNLVMRNWSSTIWRWKLINCISTM